MEYLYTTKSVNCYEDMYRIRRKQKYTNKYNALKILFEKLHKPNESTHQELTRIPSTSLEITIYILPKQKRQIKINLLIYKILKLMQKGITVFSTQLTLNSIVFIFFRRVFTNSFLNTV